MIEVIAHEVGLIVEDELAGEGLRSRQHQLRVGGLGGRDLEDVGSVDCRSWRGTPPPCRSSCA